MPHNPKLFSILRETIEQSVNQQITFADFMELVLYHPQEGYYTSRDAAIGPQGDFVTSSHMGHDFGELLAGQFVELWQHLEQPSPFHLVEMGAGQGLVAADVLTYLESHHPKCFASLNYLIIEKSDGLRQVQQRRLAPWQGRVQWTTLADTPDGSITGCVFSNELVDALPVHLVELTEAGLQEVYVTATNTEAAQGPKLQEALGPLSEPRVAEYFSWVGIDFSMPYYPPGYRTEVHLVALDWMKTLATKLKRGYVVTIDYGYPAERYYGRARSQGTLQCYYQHAHHNDPYAHLGHQDITAHVNFTALERQGERCGLTTVGTIQQAMFLMALGLGDRLNDLAQIQATDTETLNLAIQRRDTLHQLINPMGLGNFIVLVQAKNLDAVSKPLKGLTIPPLF
jgi:SAM-dependent MidA family methyltransferase